VSAAATTHGGSRAIETPEGVVLSFQLAALGSRLSALVVDGLLIGVGMLVPAALILSARGRSGGGWLVALGTMLIFLLRHFYFVWFELNQQGRTPGKRLTGIRVIDARGGQLRAEAVFVRNVTRDVELLLPLFVLVAPSLVAAEKLGVARALSSLWLLAFGLLPLLNRDRMRVGDLLAGTLVVRNPRATLSADLGAAAAASRSEGPVQPAVRFTREQLDMYGIRELHVLADLLRRRDENVARDLATVAEQVRRKIAWDPAGQDVTPRQFLRALYPALRAHLEHKMVLGERQEHKKAGRLQRD